MRLTALLLLVLASTACTPPSPAQSGANGTLDVRAVAGPVCAVETDPPDPACEPRPVAGARIFVSPSDGRDILVGQGTTDDDGRLRLELPPGSYVVAGGEVDGLLGVPEPIQVLVESGAAASVSLVYDTGIR